MQAVGFAAQIHWRRANRFVIPRSEATWESRSTMVNNRNASAKTQPVAGDCHVGLRPARNDNSGAFTILTRPCLYRRCSAGPGCPLPYKACAFARQLVQIGSAEIATAPVGPLREPAGAQNRRRGALPCGGSYSGKIRCGQRRRPWQPRRRQRRQPCRHAGQTPSG